MGETSKAWKFRPDLRETMTESPDRHFSLSNLHAICCWGTQFYSEAADVSRRKVQSETLQSLELQRAILAEELKAWVEPALWEEATLIPLVRDARYDDQRILELCDQLDQVTIAAYEEQLQGVRGELMHSLLRRHLDLVSEGQRKRASLRASEEA